MTLGVGFRPCAVALAVALALGLSACGGGGGGGGGANVKPTQPPPPPAGDTTFTGGEIDVDANSVTVLPDNLSGSINLIKGGAGTLALTGTSTYAGGTTINLGTLQLGNGGTTGSIVGNIVDNGTLAFNRSDDFSFANTVSGTGGLIKNGTNVLTLTGSNSYNGSLQVQAGGLYVDGDQTAAMGATTVAGGATLGGKGIIGGNVTVADGATLAPGSKGAIGTLTMNGNLSLSSGSKLNYDFAAPDASGARLGDFIFVRGDLTLDGVLNVNLAAGDMPGPGVYHLFFYGGTLIDNGLSVPDGWLVQTGSEKNVNLINTQGMTFSFWDVGAKNDHVNNGGGGIWQNNSPASNTNWTDASGAVNTTFNDGSFAVFQGAYGTVTVDAANGDINVAGMELGNGYVVQGDAIHMVGSENDPTHSIIRVANGTTAGLTYAATINSVLAGSVGLVKTDAGTLVLGGENTYTGGTTVSGGTLQIGNRFTSGSIIGNVTDNATLAFFRSDLYNFDGVISGSGSVTQAGIGTLVLTGNNTYGGGTTISDGVLQIGNGGTTGWITGDIVNNRYVRFNRGDDVIFNSNITGTGALIKDGAGTLILTGNLTEDGTQTYYNTDPTTISAGTLQIGNGGTTGSITGDITNNASLVFDRSDTVTFDGKVSGNGSMTQAGTGTLILTNSNYLPNGITISRGTLQVGNGGTTGQIFGGDTTNSGTLVFNYGSSPGTIFGYGGLISGSGNLIKEGAGAFSLSANNTYTGGTLISGGTLQLGSQGSTGWVAGDITNNGKLAFNRTDDVVFSHQVTGTGSVQKMGFNTLTVTGDFKNTGVTEIDLGTLQIGNGGTTGSLVGDVVNGGTLAFDRSNDLTYSGAISGTYGKLIKLGTNTLTLTGVNTFGSLRIDGATYVTDGTLRVASGASLSSKILVGGNNAHAVLQIDQGASTGFAELEDGATVDNSGVMTTEAVNVPFVSGGAVNVLNHNGGVIDNEHPSYSIDVPAVQLGLNSTLTNGTGSLIRGFTGVTSQGVVNNTGGTISGNFSDGISGSPTLVNNTNGGQITSGSNPPYNFPISFGIETFANSAVINNLGASIILGKNSGILMSDGGIVTNDGASIISGNVGVSIGSQSSATSTVNNTGGSKITGAQEGIGLGFGGTVINGAGSTIEATAAPSGDCSVTLACSIYVPVYHAFGNYGSNGTLTLSNAGYIVGDVQMDPGVINNITLIAGGYIHGALRIGVNTQSTLTLDGTAGTTQLYSNAVTGATTFGGNLIKNGGGTWVLDDNALQGVVNTSINAGSLHATQALSGDVVANAGGTLDGVPGVTGNLTNAGKVAVHGGDSAIGGNYTQVPTGTLAVSLGSKLAVNGSAALGGTLEITGAGSGYTSNTHTDVLTATGGVTGTFSQLAKDTGVVFTATTINYNANSVWLDTTGLNITAAIMRSGGSFTPASLGSAQRVQSAFTQLDKKIASGTLSDVPDNFVKAAGEFQQAPTVQAAQASLQSLSGQLHAASAAMTFEAIDASSRALADRFDDLLGKNIGYGMWTQNLDVGGDMGRAGFDGVGFQLNGWLVGNDLKIGSSGVAGFAFGQSQGKQQLEQGYDHNHSRNTEGMFYAGALNGNWYTQGRIGFGHFQQDVNRQLLLGTSAQGVGTAYSGNYNVAYGETGLHLNWAGSRIMPFVNVEYASIDRGGFAEQGAGGFGLQANAQTLDRWQAGVGLRANHHWDFGDGRALDFHASAQFQRTLASRGDVFEASFVGLQQWQPLLGIGLSRYSGVLNVGLDARLSPRTSLNFGYDYENGQRDQAQMLSAHLVMAF
jgi:fibronectin-binding autotransporter adhesin